MNGFLEKPGIAGTVFVYIGMLVPLVEELIKPTALYFLLGRKLSPREGFLLGPINNFMSEKWLSTLMSREGFVLCGQIKKTLMPR